MTKLLKLIIEKEKFKPHTKNHYYEDTRDKIKDKLKNSKGNGTNIG